jgi:hypothetical protein
VRKRVTVIGNGMAGHHAMYELSRAGIGSASKPGPSRNTGILLLGKDDANCGIIRDITYKESLTKGGPFIDKGANFGKVNKNYKPYRMGGHAMRVNIASTPNMRCLANDLNMTVYYTPWATEFQSNGYVARSARWSCGRNYTGNYGYVGGCINAGCNANVSLRTSPGSFGCDHIGYTGATQLVAQSAGIDVAYPDFGLESTPIPTSPAFNLSTYAGVNNPEAPDNFNGLGHSYDAEDEFYGWLVGYPSYVNPTFNYLGDGTTYKGFAKIYDPEDPSQKHPIHMCAAAAGTGKAPWDSVQAMYEDIAGPAYANFICKGNLGFIGDCQGAIDPCAYIPWTYREYNTLDEGYPVGGFSEYCIRQRWRVEKNFFGKGVSAEYASNEEALSVSRTTGADASKGKYVTITSKNRKIFSDEVLIGIGSKDMKEMTGDIIAALLADPHVQYPKPTKAMTVTVKWDDGKPGADWFNFLSDDLWGSFRRIVADSLLNRVELKNTPQFRNGKLHAFRVGYNDFNQLNNWEQLLAFDYPGANAEFCNIDAGCPKYGHIYNQTMKLVRDLFRAEQNAHLTVDPESIPDADHVYLDVEDESWWYSTPGQKYTWDQVWKWAAKPLPNERVGLIHSSYMYIFSGWSASAINMTRSALVALYGDPNNPFAGDIPLARYEDQYNINAPVPGFAYDADRKLTMGINAHCEGAQKPDWQDNWRVGVAYNYSDPSFSSSIGSGAWCGDEGVDFCTDLDTQYDYTNGLPNEHFTPYTNTEPICWFGDGSC